MKTETIFSEPYTVISPIKGYPMTGPETKISSGYLCKASLLATLIVLILGYIDFITGEISIDILYLICICFVTWHTNTLLGLLCITEIFFAKMTADYFSQIKIGTSLYEWNAVSQIITYIIVCLLVRKLKKVLST
jgi:hypothetical protein